METSPQVTEHKRPTVVRVENRVPQAINMPDINSGMCEYCGTKYSDCQHYKGVDIHCTYCQRSDIIGERKLVVKALADKPGVLIVVCNDYNCVKKHRDRYPTKS